MVADNFDGHEDKLNAVIFENIEYGVQVRFTISEFMDKHYFGIRKWYLGFEGEWLPTREGFSWPYNLSSMTNLYSAFAEVVSTAEITEDVINNFKVLADEKIQSDSSDDTGMS